MKMHTELEELWAHRYLYFVLDRPVIDDYEYAVRERNLITAGEVAPSPFHLPGSSDPASYPPHIKSLALQFLE